MCWWCHTHSLCKLIVCTFIMVYSKGLNTLPLYAFLYIHFKKVRLYLFYFPGYNETKGKAFHRVWWLGSVFVECVYSFWNVMEILPIPYITTSALSVFTMYIPSRLCSRAEISRRRPVEGCGCRDVIGLFEWSFHTLILEGTAWPWFQCHECSGFEVECALSLDGCLGRCYEVRWHMLRLSFY